jgi:hypothetical protein
LIKSGARDIKIRARAQYAKQEDDEGGCGRSGGDAVDPQGTH